MILYMSIQNLATARCICQAQATSSQRVLDFVSIENKGTADHLTGFGCNNSLLRFVNGFKFLEQKWYRNIDNPNIIFPYGTITLTSDGTYAYVQNNPSFIFYKWSSFNGFNPNN